MKKNLLVVVALMAMTTINAQEFTTEDFNDELKDSIKVKIEDGNKGQTIAFQTATGEIGAFERNGWFIGTNAGFRHIDGGHHWLFSISVANEGIPLYHRGEKTLPDGRRVRDYRCPISVEADFSIGNREYTPDCLSSGKYLSYEGMVYLKYRFPGFDKWTYYRFSLNTLFGIGGIYTRHDESPEGVWVIKGDEKYPYEMGTNNFAAIGQIMTELRYCPFKNLATAVLVRGGITTEPGFKLNNVWTSFRFIGQVGIQIPLTPNHRTITPIVEL